MSHSDNTLEPCVVGTTDKERASRSAFWQLTPASQCSPVTIKIDLRKIIPILFLPGIMGTNLYNDDLKKPIWTPPNNIFSSIALLFDSLRKDAKRRKNEFDKTATRVWEEGTVNNAPLQESIESQKNRKWGEVYSSCYHRFMATLQSRLNRIYNEHTINGKRILVNQWEDLLQYDPKKLGKAVGGKSISQKENPVLTQEEIDNLEKYRFEVWAGGYNWLRSNGESAKAIKERIEYIRSYYKPEDLATDKVILITHSMGGLVARSLAQLDKDLILGVLHGAIPANGAPETYVSMRKGMEFPLDIIVGKDATEVGAIMAQAEGPLELLPFGKRYWTNIGSDEDQVLSQAWLSYVDKDNKLQRFPDANGDPYSSLYMTEKAGEDKWYGMMPMHNVEKLPQSQKESTAEEEYFAKVAKEIDAVVGRVELFHNTIAGKYHASTYSFWGMDEKLPCQGRVEWMRAGDSRKIRKIEGPDDGQGHVYGAGHWQKLVTRLEPGDGTVPYSSWRIDVDLPVVSFVHGKDAVKEGATCYGHQNAYADDRAMYVSMFAVAKLVFQNKTILKHR